MSVRKKCCSSNTSWFRDNSYTFMSCYAMMTHFVLVSTSILPMRDLDWFSAFSALRAYALSNRNMFLTVIVVSLALPPAMMYISTQLHLVKLAVSNAFSSIPGDFVEDSGAIRDHSEFVEAFIDPQFESTLEAATNSMAGSRVREHMASTVLEFGAHPGESLPSFIASFVHPVHLDSTLSEIDLEETVEDSSGWELREIDVEAPSLNRTPHVRSSPPSPGPSLPSAVLDSLE
ncbi:hypothetical protein V8D89_001176 [Ganoderma adspersum]